MPRRPRLDVEKRRAEVSDMYIKGHSQAEIARKYGLTQSQISQDLKAIRKEWRNSRVRNFDDLVDEALQKIDKREREAWEAWEKSKEDYIKKATKQKGKGGSDKPDYQEVVTTEYKAMGDPRYLTIIGQCERDRMELLGHSAAKKIEVSGKDGEAVGVMVYLPDNKRESEGE